MTNKRKEIFKPLRDLIMASTYTPSDVYGMLAGHTDSVPAIGTAMLLHARDFTITDPHASAPELLCEIIWRTFIDHDSATLYGTSSMSDAGDDAIASYVEYMIGSLKMDAKQNTPTPQSAAIN